jgi:hypothetical protein
MKAEDFPQTLIKMLLRGNLRRRVNHWYKFHRADYLLLSYPKCGRTWLRVMLSNYLIERYNLESGLLLDFANLHYRNREIPKVYFTNDILHTRVTPEEIPTDKSAYYGRNVIYLTRDPRDVVVSMYFQRTKRDTNYTGSIHDFIFGTTGGLSTMIRFYNIWAENFPKIANGLLLKYEDMRSDTGATLETLFRFMGHEPDRGIIDRVVEEASFDRMKRMERSNAYERSWLKAGNVADDESFKVRRGKVGGYTDYLDPEDVEQVDQKIRTELSPFFGYS